MDLAEVGLTGGDLSPEDCVVVQAAVTWRLRIAVPRLRSPAQCSGRSGAAGGPDGCSGVERQTKHQHEGQLCSLHMPLPLLCSRNGSGPARPGPSRYRVTALAPTGFAARAKPAAEAAGGGGEIGWGNRLDDFPFPERVAPRSPVHR